ncbi:hypothetical protein [Agromyces sp. GXS1127]|uniref:hypothetical protein n=1 Tax=Agromyces sp. GXS1127 TaxID=3424181 RepID=UPI003D313BEA
MSDVRRAVLSPHVLALVVLATAGFVVLSVGTSWIVEADSGFVFDGADPEEQRRFYLMSVLPHLLAGACVSAIVGGLVGLPLLVGARLTALRRAEARAEARAAGPAGREPGTS